jgi:dihydrodipicolinate synthase/N-acetylneuraminate lyase
MGQKFGVSDLRGVMVVTPTPALEGASAVDARDTVDVEESDRMIRALVADGVDGILTNGTLGEVATLTLEEWRLFAETVATAVRETEPDLPLFIGATGPSTRDIADRMRFLQSLGVAGAFIGRPMWSALGADAMIAFHRDLAMAFPDMALVLYDNPEAFKGPIPPPVYGELARLDQVIGVKYAAVTPKFRADMDAVGNDMRIMPMEPDWLAARTLFGDRAAACWSSSALCGPEPALRLRDALGADDLETARHITDRVEWTYEPFLARRNFPEFSKYNIPLEKLRFDEAGYVRAGPTRAPYHVVPEAYAEGARENGRRWRALVEELAVTR